MTFVKALRLPTFTAGGMTLIKRLTIVASAGRIEHVFYPVFPPDTHAEEVIAWLRGESHAEGSGPGQGPRLPARVHGHQNRPSR